MTLIDEPMLATLIDEQVLLDDPVLLDGPDLATPEVGAPSYVAPRLVLTACPRILTTFDGFEVHGRAHGTQVEGVEVEVSVAGVTRTSTVRDGSWVARFEDGALTRHHAGVRPVTARLVDHWLNAAQVTEWVTVEQFVDGFVHVDARTEVTGGPGEDRHLVASGELGLGSHDGGRELVVVLVRDDAEAVVVSTGLVEPAWHHGEWRARLPLHGVTPGMYRVRAVLTDRRCPSLTRMGAGQPFRLV